MASSRSRSPKAASRPRVEAYPPYVRSLGPQAIELARQAGAQLYPWQADALTHWLALRPDGGWACFECVEICPRQNGKTFLLAARALAGLFLLEENLIMWSSHEYRTAMEAFRLVRGMISTLVERGLVDPVKTSNTNGEESFERLDTHQRLKFIARTKSSGRGFTGDCNIVDETFAYTETQKSALMPTLLTVKNAQMIYASSPPLDGDSGGPLFELRDRGESGSDDRLCWRDWGLAGTLDDLSGIDTEDQRLWATANPTFGRRITAERVEAMRSSMSTEHFAREVLGVWPRRRNAGGGVIDLNIWKSLADPDTAAVGNLVFGVDASPDRRSAAIAACGRRSDDLLHTKIVDHRSGAGWVVERVLELCQLYAPPAVMIDVTGPAGTFAAELADQGVPVIEVAGRELGAACGSFYDDAVNSRLRHADQQTLNTALREASTAHIGEAWRWARRRSSGDITPLMAITLAVHGFRVHGAGVAEPWFAFA